MTERFHLADFVLGWNDGKTIFSFVFYSPRVVTSYYPHHYPLIQEFFYMHHLRRVLLLVQRYVCRIVYLLQGVRAYRLP